jgi:site-specific recombinase XerD
MKLTAFLREHTDKSGSRPVVIDVSFSGHRVRFNTNVKCKPELWDLKKEFIRGNSKKIHDDNLVIQNCRAQVNDIFVRYRLQNRVHEITPDILKKEYLNPSLAIDFYTFMKKMIEDRKGEITFSSSKQHFATYHKLKKFQDPLFFSQICEEFVENFARHLKVELKNCPATVQNTLKNFRTYLNLAKRRGIIRKTPFDNIRVKKAHTTPQYLNEKELAALFKKYNENFLGPTHQNILRAFLFCCLTGLRISDIIGATHDWVIGNMLVFQPYKTKNIAPKILKIPLSSKAKSLINDSGTTVGHLFKVYSEPRMRKYIKEIFVHCGITKKDISWHVSRHTFASLFLEKTNDVATLQQLLGHTNVSQTMVYVHVNDQKRVEQMNVFDLALNV